MELDRKIRLFFVTYGRLLFMVIASIAIFIFIIQSLNNYVKELNKNTVITEEEKNMIEQNEKNEMEIRKYISQFIEYCNSKDIEKAYSMLTENCKKEKYTSIEDFRTKFITNFFNLKIDKYKINKENNKYIVLLTEDMLITGKTNSSKQIKIQISETENKINIID